MSRILASFALTFLISGVSGCTRAACRDNGVETAPATGLLADVGTPAGYARCKGSDTARGGAEPWIDKPSATPDVIVKEWRDHLIAKGWQDATSVRRIEQNSEKGNTKTATCGQVQHLYKKAGVAEALLVGVSFCNGGTKVRAVNCERANNSCD